VGRGKGTTEMHKDLLKKYITQIRTMYIEQGNQNIQTFSDIGMWVKFAIQSEYRA
jgi:hypothetical protein